MIGGISLIDISLEWKLHVCSVYYGKWPEASQEDVLMGYMCMLCVAYIKAGILFALEEHSIDNIVL